MTIARNQNEAPYEGHREATPEGRGHVLTRSIPDATTAAFRPEGAPVSPDEEARPLASVEIAASAT